MPFATASDVPDNVPLKYKPQFMQVWNAAYTAAIVAKQSESQAEEEAYKQAHGAILKTKQEDARNDGGQAADPTASMRYAADQERGPDGKFGSGASSSPHEHEAVAQAAGAGVLSKEEHDKQFEASYKKTMDELNAKKDAGTSNDPNHGGISQVAVYHKIFEPKAHELTADNARKEGALAAWSKHRTALDKYR